MPRGSISKKTSRLVGFWMPENLDGAVNEAVIAEDLDRSKFIRQAIREKLRRIGIKMK